MLLMLCVAGAGCTAPRAAPWVPALTLRASGARRDAGGQWRVEAGLRWRLGAARAAEPGPVDKPPIAMPQAPCPIARLCAWEARARRDALRRLR